MSAITTGLFARNSGLDPMDMAYIIIAINSGKKVAIATHGDPDLVVKRFEYFGFNISLSPIRDSKVIYNVESIEKLKS